MASDFFELTDYGECEICGQKGRIGLVPSDLENSPWVCQDCWDNEFTQCDICGEWYPTCFVDMECIGDQMVCPNCMDDFESEEEDEEEEEEK